MTPTDPTVSVVLASAALIAGAIAACSGAPRSGPADDHSAPETGAGDAGGLVASDRTDAGEPDAGVPDGGAARVIQPLTGDFHATYQGRCADGPGPGGDYQDIDVSPTSSNLSRWKGHKVRVSGIVETHVQCTEHDTDCSPGACCQDCWSDTRIAGIVLDPYICTGQDCGMRCNVPEGAHLEVWGTLDEASATGPVGPDPGTKYRPIITKGTTVLRVDGSCLVGRGDVNPADVAKKVPLAAGECFRDEDCQGSPKGEACSLTNKGTWPQNARDTCVSDADCSGARERCVVTPIGRSCTDPGVCEPCCSRP